MSILAAVAFNATAASSAEWRELADMPTARSEIYCAAIDSNIYVAGGLGFFKTVAACEVLDAASGNWSACPSLPRPLHHLAMARHGDQAIVMGGGTHSGFKTVFSVSPKTQAYQSPAD